MGARSTAWAPGLRAGRRGGRALDASRRAHALLRDHLDPIERRRDVGVEVEARGAFQVAALLNPCGMKMEELQDALEGVRVSFPNGSMGPYFTSMGVTCSPVQLDMQLELIVMKFIVPPELDVVRDADRIELLRQGLVESRQAEDRDPATKFGRFCERVMSQNHNYFKVASVDRVRKADAARAVEIYRKHVADAQHWKFSMVGALPPKEVLMPLLERISRVVFGAL